MNYKKYRKFKKNNKKRRSKRLQKGGTFGAGMAGMDRNPPLRNTILKNVRKYQNTGTSLNRNKGNSGRRRSARSEENIAAVRELLEQDPHVSSRRNPIAVSQPTFNRITRLDLRWHPYRMHVRQELLQNDCQNENFLDRFFIGDEAAFEMNGQILRHLTSTDRVNV